MRVLASVLLVIVLAVWLPGYALLAAIYPRGRLTTLERHALAFGFGLVMLPIVGLATSMLVGFTRIAVAGALGLVTLAAALVALARRRAAPSERRGYSRVPSTRVTLALVAGALVVAGGVWALAPGAPTTTPAALWLEDGEGHAWHANAAIPAGSTLRVVILVASGDAPLEGTLSVTWANATHAYPIHLAAHTRASFDERLDARESGERAFVARFSGDAEREAHFAVRVGSAPG